MNKSTVTLARQSGFKVKYLADKIGISANRLSMALRGERTIPEEKERELKAFLEMLPK